jgi:hypothetical protein
MNKMLEKPVPTPYQSTPMQPMTGNQKQKSSIGATSTQPTISQPLLQPPPSFKPAQPNETLNFFSRLDNTMASQKLNYSVNQPAQKPKLSKQELAQFDSI